MEQKTIITAVGLFATFLSIIFQIPVIIKIIHTKSVMSLSLSSYILYIFSNSFWLIYGILTKSRELIISAVISIILDVFIIYYILKYNSMSEKEYIKKQHPDMKMMYKMRYF